MAPAFEGAAGSLLPSVVSLCMGVNLEHYLNHSGQSTTNARQYRRRRHKTGRTEPWTTELEEEPSRKERLQLQTFDVEFFLFK